MINKLGCFHGIGINFSWTKNKIGIRMDHTPTIIILFQMHTTYEHFGYPQISSLSIFSLQHLKETATLLIVLSERALWTMNFDTSNIKIGWKMTKIWAFKEFNMAII